MGMHICLPVVSSRCSQMGNQEEPSSWLTLEVIGPDALSLFPEVATCGHSTGAAPQGAPALECQGRSNKSKANATSHRPFPVWDLPLSTYHYPMVILGPRFGGMPSWEVSQTRDSWVHPSLLSVLFRILCTFSQRGISHTSSQSLQLLHPCP